MKKIIYYVASSIDGYIAGPNGDISQFILQGEGIDRYQADLLKFETVIMGRKTYEFGFQFGLVPGQPAYPHMQHILFSNTANYPNLSDTVQIEKLSEARIREIKEQATTDIYLCGGGELAGWLLDRGLIDTLKLKLNPIILGGGTRLFGSSTSKRKWKLSERESFSDGLQLLSYD